MSVCSSGSSCHLNPKAIGKPLLEVKVEGKPYTLQLVDSYERPGGTTYFYSTDDGSDGEGGPLSTFTMFEDGRPFWSSLVLDGRSYTISPSRNHYVVTRSIGPPLLEAPPTKAMLSGQFFVTASVQAASVERHFALAADALWSVASTRRRACCTWWNRIPFVVVVNTGAKNPYGITDKAKVEARVAHYFDRMNAALRNSGESNFVYYREIAYLDFPDSVADNGYLTWAQLDPGVGAVRARNKAAASLLLLGRFVQFEAVILSPGDLLKPNYRIAIAGGYIRDESNLDVEITQHEMGHVLGKDHEYKWSRLGMFGTDPFPLRIGWSSCERLEHCLMAYGDCGQAMATVEIFSGKRSAMLGYPNNPDVENSVAVSSRVGYEMARDWP